MIVEVTFSKPYLVELTLGGANSAGPGVPGKDGSDGLSAFEVAVLNGFAGNVSQWLQSLKGDKGDAFTFQDFTPEQLTSLQGPPGEDAESGIIYIGVYAPTEMYFSQNAVTSAEGDIFVCINDETTGQAPPTTFVEDEYWRPFLKKAEPGPPGQDGKNLEFQWNDTNLGIRVQGDESYTYQDLKGEKGDNGESAFVAVDSLTAEEASKYEESQIAYFRTGKYYFGKVYRWFVVKDVNNAKKFLPIGITYVTADDNGINVFDPLTEQYILYKRWEQLKGDSGSKIHSGTGIPDPNNYEVGDWYISTITSDVYEKTTATEWTFRTNIKGVKGDKGDPGSGSGGITISRDIKFKQRLYRNLEGDNNLPTDDYTGRTIPLQTPMQVVEIGSDANGTFYIIMNMPYVIDLVKNPNNWGAWSITVQPQPDSVAQKVMEASYLGSYNSSPNCCKIYTQQPIAGCASGNLFAIMSWKAYGLHIDTTIHFPKSTGEWNNLYGGSTNFWQRSDGTYCSLAYGYNPSLTPNVRSHLFTANSIHGPWIDVTGANGGDVLAPFYPSGYIGIRSPRNIFKISGSDGVYAGSCGLIKSTGGVDYGILIFDEYLRYVNAIKVDTSYSFLLSQQEYYSMTFHDGLYYYVVHDGTPRTGKRVVLCSDNIRGVFEFHSYIYDNEQIPFGSMMSFQTANGCIFSFMNDLYFTASGQGEVKSGNYNNHEAYLFKLNPSTRRWGIVSMPWLIATHSPHLWSGNYEWAKDHLGSISQIQMIGNDRLYFIFDGSSGTDTYQSTIAYIDLSAINDY